MVLHPSESNALQNVIPLCGSPVCSSPLIGLLWLQVGYVRQLWILRPGEQLLL